MSQNRKYTFIILISFFNFANAQNFNWVKTLEKNAKISINKSTITDSFGNTYITGHFFNSVDFDNSNSQFVLTSDGEADIFLLKLDSNGDFIWAKKFGNQLNNYSTGISLDIDQNIHLYGHWQGTIDFNPDDIIVYNITSSNFDGFVLKLNSNGEFIWVYSMEGEVIEIQQLKFDLNGNINIAGYFEGDAAFNFQNTNNKSISNGLSDCFIMQLTSSGIFNWVKTIGNYGYDYGFAIDTDPNGNIAIGGRFQRTVDFDPNEGIVTKSSIGTRTDAFLLLLDRFGSYKWVKTIIGSGFESLHSVAFDVDNSIFISGSFNGNTDFNPDNGGFFIENNPLGAYIAKLNSTGDFLWAKKIVESGAGLQMEKDQSNNIYAFGYFFGLNDFNPDLGSDFILDSGTKEDIYVAKYDQNGNFIWAKSIGGIESCGANSFHIDSNENLIISGNFTGLVDLNPNQGVYEIDAGPIEQSFLLKLSPNAIPISVSSTNWDNPSTWENNLVPSINQNVIISNGHTITISRNSAVAKSIDIRGNLIFENSISKLTIGN